MIIGFIVIAILVLASHEGSINRSKETHDRLNRIIRDLEELKR